MFGGSPADDGRWLISKELEKKKERATMGGHGIESMGEAGRGGIVSLLDLSLMNHNNAE